MTVLIIIVLHGSCVDRIGYFECTCGFGYQLQSDGEGCIGMLVIIVYVTVFFTCVLSLLTLTIIL